MPAARLFFLLVGVSLLGVAGIFTPALAQRGWLGVPLGVLILDLGLLLAFAWDLRRARGVLLTARRKLPTLLVQGAEAEITVAVEGPRQGRLEGRPLEVRLREGLHPALARAPRRRALRLAAGTRKRWSYSLVPRRRGTHAAGPLTARVQGPWRLAWSQRDLIGSTEMSVYPQVRWQGRVGQLLAQAHRHELGQAPLRFRGEGQELYALREYLSGDPLNRIHWKATARHGRLVSREDTWERGERLVILLDCGRAMAATTGAGDPRSKLDYALAASLALTRLAAGRGDRVQILAFSNHIERQVLVRSGTAGARQAYGRLFDLEARLEEPAFDLAASAALAREGRSATVVVMTSMVDLASGDLLRRALFELERRHKPLLINLEDAELRSLAYGEPATAPEAFAQGAALEILLANRRLAKELRRSGIRAVTTSADQLALETLDAYLDLFRRRSAA